MKNRPASGWPACSPRLRPVRERLLGVVESPRNDQGPVGLHIGDQGAQKGWSEVFGQLIGHGDVKRSASSTPARFRATLGIAESIAQKVVGGSLVCFAIVDCFGR